MSDPDEKIWQAEVAKKPSPNGWGLVRLKLLMALLVGLVTAAAGCLSGLYSLRQPHSWVCLPQRETIREQWILSTNLNKYKEKHGAYPLTLEEMTSQWNYEGKPLEKQDIDDRIEDGWNNPMVYASDGETWELISYGADGKSGGIGLDADIRCIDTDDPSYGNNLYKNSPPTIKQVIQSEHFNTAATFSGVFGIICFFVALCNFVSPRNADKRHKTIIPAVALMLVTSYFINVLISVQSVASGH